MLPIGHYRDLDDPDSFVWIRGFPDMERRRRALEAFYIESPAWLENREAANATMIDSDNVLLLRPLEGRAFDLSGLARPGVDAYPLHSSLVVVTVFMLEHRGEPAMLTSFANNVMQQLNGEAQRVAWLVTEESSNTFARLPVREKEWAFVAAGIVSDGHAARGWRNCLERAAPELGLPIVSTEHPRLSPAARSLYR